MINAVQRITSAEFNLIQRQKVITKVYPA